MMRFISVLILFALVVTIGISTQRIAQKKAINSSLKSNDDEFDTIFHETLFSLPDFEIKDLFNKKQMMSKSDFSGNKYSLVNFFASWCTTCMAEHQILMRIKEENLLPIYGIAWRDIDGETKKYLKKNGNPYQKIGTDEKGLFSKIASVRAVPETWIVDSKGVVVRKITGNLQDFSVDEIKEFIMNNQNIAN